MKKKFVSCVILSMILTSCGESSSENEQFVSTHHEMINGTVDDLTSHLGVVGLVDREGESNGGAALFCTGVLIHPQWVLTAAHCVTERISDGDGYRYIVADKMESSRLGVAFGSNIEVIGNNLHWGIGKEGVYFPENFGQYTVPDPEAPGESDKQYTAMRSDIALIKLDVAITEPAIKPILPQPKWLGFKSENLETPMTFSGFGVDQGGLHGIKLQFTGPISKYCGSMNPSDTEDGCRLGEVSYSGCHPYYEHPRTPVDKFLYSCLEDGESKTERVLLPFGSYYYDMTNGGPCQGDSGGPGLSTIGDIEYVSSITSFGDDVCAAYGVSTAVQDFYDWILSYIPDLPDLYVEKCGNEVDDDGDGEVDEGCEHYVVPYCGDGIVNLSENCDGTAFFNDVIECAFWGDEYISGTVTCNENCSLNFDNCVEGTNCGNSRLDAGESCDGDLFMGDDQSCSRWNSIYVSGKVKCNDCVISYSDCSMQKPVEICDDQIDNDENGQTDCDDAACAGDSHCKAPGAEICSNGKDDDGDGKIDCQDPDCSTDSACAGKCLLIVGDDGKYLPPDCSNPACSKRKECRSESDSSSKSSGCSAVPENHGSEIPAALILAMLGAGLMVRRRKSEE